RRQFLRGAAVVGGAAVLSAIVAACGGTPAAAPAATTAPAAGATSAPAAPVVLKGAKVAYLAGGWTFLPELDPVIDAFANDWARQSGVTLTMEREGTNLLAKIQTAIETQGGANTIQYAQPPALFQNSLAAVSDAPTYLSDQAGG